MISASYSSATLKVSLGIVFEFICTGNVFSLNCLKYVVNFVPQIGLGYKIRKKSNIEHILFILK